jgi:hypothetical protein
MKQIKTTFITLITLAFLLFGCSPGEPVLQVTGNVAAEKGWTEAQIQEMDPVSAEYTNKDGETTVYTGVLIAHLLNEAGINEGASIVTFVGDDGYTAEVALGEVTSCQDCIVAFQEEGGLRIVMPAHTGKLQVRGVIEIQVE